MGEGILGFGILKGGERKEGVLGFGIMNKVQERVGKIRK